MLLVVVPGVTVAVLLLLAMAGLETEAEGGNGGWLVSTQFSKQSIQKSLQTNKYTIWQPMATSQHQPSTVT